MATSNDKTIANSRETTLPTRTRVPMSLPQLKLAVPEIPGYHLHWMRGDPARIAQAQRAGYEFVEEDEVNVYNSGLANDMESNGSTDLGTRVSLSAGSDVGQDGQPERLYLMKLKQEFWEEDQKVLADKNEEKAAALRGEAAGDHAYIPDAHKKSVQNMFTKKH
jgi:hypothetical protein